jgi:hypothetical protein
MSKTSDRMTSYEKGIYNEGQSLIRQGHEKMEQARQMVKERQEAAATKLKELQEKERSARIIRARNERFQDSIANLKTDIHHTSAVYQLEHDGWRDVTTEFDLDAPLCKLTLVFRPKV